MLGVVVSPQSILDFWFGDVSSGSSVEKFRKRWFTVDSLFDETCRSTFEASLIAAKNGELRDWFTTAHDQLAFIILCDQLPRNIYRGLAKAFAWDKLALEIAKRGVESGADRDLLEDQRSFFYMPFEHSENILDQHTAVGLFAQLRDDSPPQRRQLTGNTLRYAQKHRDIIIKFGRFPHRNQALGRTSTQAELMFITQSDGFGQTA